ncbi:MAG: hypothetical protein V7K50_25280 [Nostoc sp.]|uniref:hypothetical protein n=1 Tax=Nostoc sp. TaxID=1180 RepID=UPI002FF6474A
MFDTHTSIRRVLATLSNAISEKSRISFSANRILSLDPKPLTLKLRPGIRDKVSPIPNWQSKFWDAIEVWLQEKLD